MREDPYDPLEVLAGRPSSSITLAELDMLFRLSARAMNVCLNNDLNSLEAIARAQCSPGGLAVLRNCGKKTVMELEHILRVATHRMGVVLPETPTSDVVSVPAMEPVERAAMLVMIEDRLPLLSARARNALWNFLDEETPEAILDGILLSGFDLRKLRNVGSKTIAELREFGRSVFEQRPAPAAVGVTETPETAVFLALKDRFDREEIALIRHAILQEGRFLPSVLELVKLVVDLWSKRPDTGWSSIEAFTRYTYERGDVARVAVHIGLARERMRKMIARWDQEFEAHFTFLDHLPGPFKPEPAMPHGCAMILTKDIADGINARSGTAWGQRFIARVLVLASKKRYKVVPWQELGLLGNKGRDLDSRSPLLIRSDSVPAMVAMAQHFCSLLSDTRTSDSVHRFEEIALPLGVEWNEDLTVAMRPLLVALAPGIRFDGDRIQLPPNKRKRREDVVVEALDELDTPTHVTVLVERLRAIDPERKWTPESVRNIIVRFKDRFISFSRTSTYGLRKWEQGRPEVKGGTIRSMVQELLLTSETPLHVDQLATAIRTFRPTTSAASIKLNLQLDPGDLYRFYPGGYVGLTSRTYDRMPVPVKGVPGGLMRKSVVRKYIGQPLPHFIEYIAKRCAVPADHIERTVRAAIANGRLGINEIGIITWVADKGSTDDAAV